MTPLRRDASLWILKLGASSGAGSGGSYKKWRPLQNIERLSELFFFAIFKQGASRGAASSGSLFEKCRPLENVKGFSELFANIQAGC